MVGRLNWQFFPWCSTLALVWVGRITPERLYGEKARFLRISPERYAGWRVLSDYSDAQLDLRQVLMGDIAQVAVVDTLILGRFPGAKWVSVLPPYDGPEAVRWIEALQLAATFYDITWRLVFDREQAWQWLLRRQAARFVE